MLVTVCTHLLYVDSERYYVSVPYMIYIDTQVYKPVVMHCVLMKGNTLYKYITVPMSNNTINTYVPPTG